MKQYIIELVIKEPPYICLGYVKNNSIEDNVLHFTKMECDALVVSDKETMDTVMGLIKKHNSNRDNVRVMDWITEIGNDKRVYNNEITW